MPTRIKDKNRNLYARPLRPRIYYFFLLILYGFISLPNTTFADTSLRGNTLDIISRAVFEVVVSKPIKDSLSYERPLPMDLLPFSIRTDKYYPIGTAFAISPTEFVSAAHVANLGLDNRFGEISLRDKEGKVYRLDKIVKYSDQRDFVVFSLKDKIAKDFFEVNINPEINQKVYAVGNALGEGIVIRDGLYTSATPEEEKGEWKWIRFSAAASPGSSGGPLLDQNGKVIGIILKKSPNENLNYALPIKEALNAKINIATIHRKIGYLLDNSDLSSMGFMEKESILPKSFEEFNSEMIEKEKLSFYNIMKSFFKKNKENIFPNGKGSTGLVYKTEETLFPSLIMKGDDSNWDISSPRETKEADLSNNGYLKYGGLVNSLFFYIRKPDDIPLDRLYNDPRLIMDLILKGLRLPRQIGPEKIKITSLGNSQEAYVFVDSYGRKWFVKAWFLEYSDEKIVTFSLPVPGGCITLLRAGQSGRVDTAYISDLKILTNFIYVSYDGTLKQWHEFLKMKDVLPAIFSTIGISFDYKRAFHYKSKRLSFAYSPDVLHISEKSYLKLTFGYFKANDLTTWDVNTISVNEDKNSPTGFIIKRNMIPSKELGDKYQEEWKKIAAQKFPFSHSSYYRDKTTNISTVIRKMKDKEPIVLYTAGHEKSGKVNQKEMQAKLDKFLKNLIVYEDGVRTDVVYENRPDAYHDQGGYHQALFDVDKLANITPRSADGFIHRGEVYKDKGNFDLALQDYSEAVELNAEDVKTYFGKDIIARLYGAMGRLTEAMREIEKVTQDNPYFINISTEDLKKVIEDVREQKIKEELAIHLFKGRMFNSMDLTDEAFREYNRAIADNPDYSVSYDIRGLAYFNREDNEKAMADYSKALELNPKDIVACNRLGVRYKEQQNYEKAIELFNKALELNPMNAKTYKNRGDAYYDKKEYDRAIADYDAAIQLYNQFNDAYLNRGLALHNKGNYDQAIIDFDTIISNDPKYINAYSARGSSNYARGEYDIAIMDYNRAIERDAGNAIAYMSRGLAYYRKKEFNLALSDYDRAITINPRYSEAYNNRGSIFHIKGNQDQALSDYNRAIELDPQNGIAYNNRGIIYQDKGELDKATLEFSKATEINPNYFDGYKNKGLVYHKKGRYDLAILDYNKAIEINPKHPEAYFNRGLSYQEKKEFGLALSDYNKAIEIKPDYSDVFINRGVIFDNKRMFDNAISEYSKAITMGAKQDVAYYNRGTTYYHKGDWDQAIIDYSKAIELNPNYAEAYKNRGTAYRAKKDFDRAISDFSKAIDINPDIPSIGDAFLYRGSAYASKGEFQRALSDLNKAIEINPRNVIAYDEKGMTYGRKGDHDLAIAEFNKVLEIDPRNASAYNNRGYTYLMKGEIDRAFEDFNRSIEINTKFALAYINRGNAYYVKRDQNKACFDWKKACENGSCAKYQQARGAKFCE